MNEPLQDEETNVTDITIEPDGRVYVFGTSRRVLEVLEQLRPDDPRVCRLLGHVRRLESRANVEVTACSRQP
jgi:hypothetical protein